MTRAWSSLLATASAIAGATAAQAQVSVALPHPGNSPTPVAAQSPTASAPPPPQVGLAVPLPAQQQPGTVVPLPVPTPVAPVIPTGTDGRPDINPYDRDIEMTVPLMYHSHPLGEVPVLLTHDDRFLVDAAPFLKLIDTLLNDQGRAKLAQAVGTRDRFAADDIAATGVSLNYDPSSLSVVVLDITPNERATEALFKTPTREDETPDLLPAKFSAFLNINAIENRIWGGYNDGFMDPAFYFNGAARLGGVVLEGDFQVAQQFLSLADNSYRFDRNYVRLVYDQPDQYRRWYLGDLTPEVRGEQSFVQMGGIGVSRQRNRFDQFRSAILQGNRQIVLQQSSTVEIYRNGSLYKQFQLQPGSYDLSALPLVTGSNDIQIRVRDASGTVQNLDYQSYLDPIDLAPGDYEYSAYIGKLSNRFGLSPTYKGPLAFSGFFRKAFLDRPAIGVGLQASRQNQIITGQTQFVLGNGSRLQLDGGVSRASHYGEGFSVGLGYDQIVDRGDLSDSFTIAANYLSKRFAGLGFQEPDNASSVDINAQYARAINRELTLLFGGTYVKNRSHLGDSYRLYASTSYRISRVWTVQGGIDYSKFAGSLGGKGGIGFSLSLVYQPNYRDRGELRHDDTSGQTELSYTHAADDRIGSVGYGGVIDRDSGSVDGQAFADYIGNRFDATLSHSAYGPDFGHVGQQQITALRVGTSLAFAGGHFGIGRRVNDSFAVLYPHETLKGHSVVAGQSLSDNDYLSKSGTLGGAVNGYLTSYVTQSIQYDVENPPPGYDVGAGVVRVRPPYHSGYGLEIGTAAFASATGTLEFSDGNPVPLNAGKVIALDVKDKASMSFFTNSIGRFAIQNLRPGVRYRVELFGSDDSFQFTVPRDTHGLVDLKIVKLAAQK